MRTKDSRARKAMPVLYGAAATLFVAIALPSALRPPPDAANSASQFSPDAPPDKNADQIIKSVQQAGSQTAGGAPAAATTTTIPATAIAAPVTTTTVLRRPSRAGCYGQPPMQIESVYSIACEPEFIGNNGGATSFGVTATDINLVVNLNSSSAADGEINDTSAATDNTDRTFNDIRKYLNQHYEFYGRQLRFFNSPYHGADTNEPTQRSEAQRVINTYQPFVTLSSDKSYVVDEYAKHTIFNWNVGNFNNRFHSSINPYSWEAVANGNDAAGFGAEYACKQLRGYKPFPTGDNGGPGVGIDYSQPRTFAMISLDYPSQTAHDEALAALQTCGINPDPDVQTYFTDPQDAATTIALLKRKRISTIIWNNDVFSLAYYMQTAESQNYRPEWFSNGFGGNDIVLQIERPYAQLRNLFGITLNEILRDFRLNECFRAVRSVDPGFTADSGSCGWWAPLVHIADAIQLAGPKLTTTAFANGVLRIPHRDPEPANYWAVSGGYAPGKWTYPNAAAVFWYDPNSTDVDGSPGAWRYADCARRYLRGQFPTGPSRAYTMQGSTTGQTIGECPH